MVYAFNPSTQEPEVGGSLGRPAWFTEGVPGVYKKKKIGVSLLNFYSTYSHVLLVYREGLYVKKSYSCLSAVAPILVNYLDSVVVWPLTAALPTL